MSAGPVIATQGLRYAYPGGAPLSFPDVEVGAGDVLLLQGPSGAGKSTWLALVAGLLRPAEGRLVVAGQDLAALPAAARDAWRGRTIGFLPQRLHLSEALSVEGNLGLVYFAVGQRPDAAAIRAVLAALGVGHLAPRRPSQLSGGQAQRVALARAVLLAPRLILADEPTASLDDAAAEAAVALLRQVAAQGGAALVIATHDARVRAALPAAGRLQLEAPAVPEAA